MNAYNINRKPGKKLNNILKKGGHFTMSAKHPQSKKELERLEPIIKNRLETVGTSTKQMRQIANELGIDAGLVVKVKNQLVYTKAMAATTIDEQIKPVDITKPADVIDIDDNLPVIDIEDQVKENNNTEEEVKKDNIVKEESKVTTRKKRTCLTTEQEIELCSHYINKEFNTTELAELYNVSSSTVSRVLARHNTGKGKSNMGKKKKTTKKKYNNIPKNRDIEEVVAADDAAKEKAISEEA